MEGKGGSFPLAAVRPYDERYNNREPATKPANARFDHMMKFSLKLAFGKRAIIEASTASHIGYAGVDEFEFRGKSRLEFGSRLVRASRGCGYATEAASPILEVTRQAWQGERLAFIEFRNGTSRNVLFETGLDFVSHIRDQR